MTSTLLESICYSCHNGIVGVDLNILCIDGSLESR